MQTLTIFISDANHQVDASKRAPSAAIVEKKYS